jgi:pimeloyl-ACP methyl ester carboxylesterase
MSIFFLSAAYGNSSVFLWCSMTRSAVPLPPIYPKLPETSPSGRKAFSWPSWTTCSNSLQLRDGPGYHILGHSWGGRIAAAFAATQPQGLQRLVLASGIASSHSWVEGIQIICKQLPSDAQSAINEGEQKGNLDSTRFKSAMDVFFRNYFCRAEPFPPKELLPALKNMSEDKTVRQTMSVYSVTLVVSILSFVLYYVLNIVPLII